MAKPDGSYVRRSPMADLNGKTVLITPDSAVRKLQRLLLQQKAA